MIKASIAGILKTKVTWSFSSLVGIRGRSARCIGTNDSGRLKPKNLLYLTLKLKKKRTI